LAKLPVSRSTDLFKYFQVGIIAITDTICYNAFFLISVANMNNMSTIVVRVSSTEIYDDQNILIHDIKRLDKNEEILYKTESNQNIRNQQKYK